MNYLLSIISIPLTEQLRSIIVGTMINNIRIILLTLSVSIFFLACEYTYDIRVIPSDAAIRVNGSDVANPCVWKTKEKSISVSTLHKGYVPVDQEYSHDSFFTPARITIEMEQITYKVSLDTTVEKTHYSLDNGPFIPLPFEGEMTEAEHLITLRGEDGIETSFPLDVQRSEKFLFRLQEKPPFMHQLGIYTCGCAPKQMDFSPDNKFLYIPLLGGLGFQIFDIEKRQMIHTINVGSWYKRNGFVEGLFIEKYKSYFVSQMDTARIFEYTINGNQAPVFKRDISTEGTWSKVIAYSDVLDILAVSNWCSNDVSIIEYSSGKVIKKIKGIKVPRGLAFSHDGKFLYIGSFEGGVILKYATDTWVEKGRIYKKYGAMRHLRITPDDKTLFVSNMYHSWVYEIDAESFTIVHTYNVYTNPNTIEIDEDARLLFVSCRGPNNLKNYTWRSPKDGKIMVFDIKSREHIATIQGGNQPTGLDLSTDGNILVFSNFKDNNFELYDISALKQMIALKDRHAFFPLNLFAMWESFKQTS